MRPSYPAGRYTSGRLLFLLYVLLFTYVYSMLCTLILCSASSDESCSDESEQLSGDFINDGAYTQLPDDGSEPGTQGPSLYFRVNNALDQTGTQESPMMYFRGADRCASVLRRIVRKEKERERRKARSGQHSDRSESDASDASESESESDSDASESESGIEEYSADNPSYRHHSGTQREESDPLSSVFGSMSQTQTSVNSSRLGQELIHTQLEEDEGTLVDIANDSEDSNDTGSNAISRTRLSDLLVAETGADSEIMSPLFTQYDKKW